MQTQTSPVLGKPRITESTGPKLGLITAIATLGGSLFGYDTGVISPYRSDLGPDAARAVHDVPLGRRGRHRTRSIKDGWHDAGGGLTRRGPQMSMLRSSQGWMNFCPVETTRPTVIPTATHAIGDAGVANVLDAFEYLASAPGRFR